MVLVSLCLFPLTVNSDTIKTFTLSSYTQSDLTKYSVIGNHQDISLISQAAEVIKLHEGFSSKSYKCAAGQWTQGYGRQTKPNRQKISEHTAYVWLLEDIQEIVVLLDEKIPWWRTLNSTRQQVLINLVYNVGLDGALKFKGFLSAIKTRQYTKASKELLYVGSKKSKYYKQVGPRAVHLAYAIKSGKWDMETMRTLYS